MVFSFDFPFYFAIWPKTGQFLIGVKYLYFHFMHLIQYPHRLADLASEKNKFE